MTFLSAWKLAAHAATLMVPALVALTGCGADNAVKYPDKSSYCNARAKAECSSEVVKACAVVDVDHCISNRQAACFAIMPMNTTYNPHGAEPCVNAVSSAYADAKLTADENRAIGVACLAVFDGPGSANTPCGSDVECKVSSGLRCVLTATMGSCQVPERVQGGGACTTPSQQCIEGFHCGLSQHCDINGQIGDPCSNQLPCVATAQCTTYMCASKFNDGTPCTNDDQCLHGLCARGTGAAQGLCVAEMTLAPNEPFCIDAR